MPAFLWLRPPWVVQRRTSRTEIPAYWPIRARSSALRTAIARARRLVGRPGRVERAQDLVLNRLTIDAMAASLIDAYKSAQADVT